MHCKFAWFFYFYKMNIQQLKKETLKYFWGYDAFRDLQEEIIDSILQGKDTLALLPTGGGKSLCYQLPALVSQGVCLVVSPLLALMRDQVLYLKSRGIEAEYLGSDLDDTREEEIYQDCKEGITKLLYVSPERLSNGLFLRHMEEIQLSFIAVDEAHCISEWGADFRPSYRFISQFRNEFKNVPCLALTATATPTVLKGIEQKLSLRNAEIFQKSFNRDNLKIQMLKISDKYHFIFQYLTLNPSAGIIYTRTRKEAELLVRFLKQKGLKNIDYYHAGLSSGEKHQRQKKWQNTDDFVLVSTNAFGMGIDKDNVRFVMHYSLPASIENYYQEIGRGGRDGYSSEAILLWNEQDLMRFDDILKNQIPSKKIFEKTLSFLYSIFQIADGEDRMQQYELNLNRVVNFTKSSLAAVRNILNFIHNQEIIYYNDVKTLSSLELKFNPSELDLLPPKEAYFVEFLLRNLAGIQHQRVYFNEDVLSQKIGVSRDIFSQRLRDLMYMDLVDYIDGGEKSIRFLKPRNDIMIPRYWSLFEQIQKNKLQKWEEIKYFVRDNHFCKMKMVLAYFGEHNTPSCGQCTNCLQKQTKTMSLSTTIAEEIKTILRQNPACLEELSVRLAPRYPREQILEELIILLDLGTIRMLDFQTYTLNES